MTIPESRVNVPGSGFPGSQLPMVGCHHCFESKARLKHCGGRCERGAEVAYFMVSRKGQTHPGPHITVGPIPSRAGQRSPSLMTDCKGLVQMPKFHTQHHRHSQAAAAAESALRLLLTGTCGYFSGLRHYWFRLRSPAVESRTRAEAQAS